MAPPRPPPCFCGKPSWRKFTRRDTGLEFYRCKRHGKPLIELSKRGTMAIPKQRR